MLSVKTPKLFYHNGYSSHHVSFLVSAGVRVEPFLIDSFQMNVIIIIVLFSFFFPPCICFYFLSFLAPPPAPPCISSFRCYHRTTKPGTLWTGAGQDSSHSSSGTRHLNPWPLAAVVLVLHLLRISRSALCMSTLPLILLLDLPSSCLYTPPAVPALDWRDSEQNLSYADSAYWAVCGPGGLYSFCLFVCWVWCLVVVVVLMYGVFLDLFAPFLMFS